MMDQTVNRGYPYPECDPPLVKDLSDIAQLRDLAEAVDADVQAVSDRADDLLVRPDAARMGMLALATVTVHEFTPFFDFVSFDTTGSLMADTVRGVIRVIEPGWYMIGGWVDATSATYLGLRMAFLQDGVRANSYCPQAETVPTNKQYVEHNATIFAPNPCDLSMTVRVGAATPNYPLAARIWCVQVAKL